MANPPTKKPATNKQAPQSTNRGRPAAGRPAGLFTWIAVGLVVAVIVAIVVVKVTSSNSPAKVSSVYVKTSPTTFANVTTVPASTLDTVGTSSPAIQVLAPTSIPGQPPLNWPDAKGVKRPTVFYFGAEYCPYCAAERWPMIVALSRFGTFNQLGNMQSSASDIYPNTPTFTFVKTTYASSYINFDPVEYASNVPDPSSAAGYTLLMKPTKEQLALVAKYDTPSYIPGLQQAGSIPFISVNNRYFIAGASYSPSSLAGVSRDKIAAGLSDSANLLSQGILTTANLLTATICVATHDMPSNVCTSAAVKAANATLKIKTS